MLQTSFKTYENAWNKAIESFIVPLVNLWIQPIVLSKT